MAKISSYPSDANVTVSDRLIGTDNENSNETKNFQIGDIIDLAETVITPNLINTYIPYNGANQNVNLGPHTLTIQNGVVLGDLNVTGGLRMDSNAGAIGRVLTSLGSGVTPIWADLGSLISGSLYKGSFYDSITQTLSAPNTATPVILRDTDSTATNGISIVSDGTNLSRITFVNSGNYNILFSAQLANSGGTAQTVDFWLRKNGSTAAANIPNTNGKIQLQGNANYLMAAWNYFVTVNAGDYIQLVWAATSTNVTMVAAAANGLHPETPSIIVTANIV